MKINSYQFPKSSFLSIEKDFSIIVNKLSSNERLLKLLFYNSSNALKQPDLTQEQKIQVLTTNIKLVPQIKINNELKTYVVVAFDDFAPNATNPEFRNNLLIFDIICHHELWNLSDFQMRPYKIMGEIDSLFNGQRLTGIGKTDFVTCQQLKTGTDYIGFTMVYQVTHGEEDKKETVNPQDWADFVSYFDQEYNND